MKKFINESWLVLVMGVVFAALLAGTQTSLQAQIEENQVRALNEAIRAVVPGTESTETLDVDGTAVFKCLDADSALVGWAIDLSGPGFVDKIRAVVGLSADTNRVTGIKVIDHKETPGLGNKIEGEWADQYQDRDANRKLTVVKREAKADEPEIQAITGATYSSKFVTDIVNQVVETIRPKLAELG